MSVLKIKNQNNDWIQIPTIKGDKGDPFTYADFTPEQLESLKGKDGISPTVSVTSDTSDDYRLSFTDETHTVTTPNLIPEAEKIFDVYPTDSTSGSIASFPDGADDIPLKSCIVQVEPVQEGSGDPSPDNVRPISGFTGVEVQRTGKNLLALPVIRFSEGTATVDNCFYLKQGTYTLSYSCTETHRFGVRMMDANGVIYTTSADAPMSGLSYNASAKCHYVGADIPSGSKTFTLTIKHDCYIRIVSNLTGGGFTDVQLELGSTATDYEPYAGNTYPITFPSEAGTVYGGYVDVLNGELVVDRYYGTMDNKKVNISTSSNGYFWYTTLYSLGYPYIKSDNAKLIANRLRMIVNTKETDPDGVMSIYGNGIIRWKEKGELTLNEYKAYLTDNPLFFCYEVKEPTHYPLTSNQINSLYGQNNLWANTGDTEVEYRASTKMYIDRKITEAVAAALNS